jgi:hypothetical protein
MAVVLGSGRVHHRKIPPVVAIRGGHTSWHHACHVLQVRVVVGMVVVEGLLRRRLLLLNSAAGVLHGHFKVWRRWGVLRTSWIIHLAAWHPGRHLPLVKHLGGTSCFVMSRIKIGEGTLLVLVVLLLAHVKIGMVSWLWVPVHARIMVGVVLDVWLLLLLLQV